MRFFVALLLVIANSADGYTQIQLNNLQGLLQHADKHAPTALQSILLPKIAKQDLSIAQSALYPKINVFGTGDYYPIIATQVIPGEIVGKPGTYVTAQFGLPYVFAAGAELSMPVVNLEKWTQISKAHIAAKQSQYTAKAALESFHIQLIQSYYQTLVGEKVLMLNKENATTAAELLRIMEERNNSGVINPSDYNRSKNLVLDVESGTIAAQKQVQQAYNNLYAVLNIKSDSMLLTEDIAQFSWPILSGMNLPESRPSWKEADYKLRIAESSLKESRYAAMPRMSLTARYAYNMQSKFETSGSNIEFNNAYIGARIDFPLFQGNYYRSAKNKTKLQLESIRLEQERVHATLIQQQKDWFASYTAAYNKHATLEQKVKNASDNLRIAKLNVKEGLMEFDEFNNIFLEYNRARIEQLQNLADGILYYLLSTQNF